MENPARRNRKLGTAKHERGYRNKMVIPLRTHPKKRYYLENLGPYTTQKRCFGKHELLFVIEKPRAGCTHACSVEEIVRVLSFVPEDDLRLLKFVVLRQPKRKEELLGVVWGVWCPDISIGNLTGCAIFLETQDITKSVRWKKPFFSSWLGELERWRLQGAKVVEGPHYLELFYTFEAVRQRQLFETLPHEIGHHRHWLTDKNYWHRTDRECEEFAEKYAREFIEKWGSALD